MDFTADFSGVLKKKGAINKAFKKRWFELVGRRLFYYKNHEKKKTPYGVILIKGCKILDHNKKNRFKIAGNHLKRTYELEAKNESEKKKWCEALQNCISGKKSVVKPKFDDPNIQKAEPLSGDLQSSKIGVTDFELMLVLGRGAFGKVFKVKEKKTGKIYAMKVLGKEMLIKQKMVKYTIAEKKILQQMDHPFIVGLHYAFQTPAKIYLVLDFLSGGELFYHLSNEVKFNVDRARFYTAEILLALGHLHSKDIVYRDLKPENVVLDGDGHIQITDFGLAKSSVSNRDPTYTFCGTPEYLAPEIIKGKGHSKPVDWWALGILLFEMLVGLPPFYSENINEMYELILKTPVKFPSYIPSDACSLLKGLLEKDPGKRLGSGSGDYKEIQKHAFFDKIDWDKLYKRKLTPPFIPKKNTTYVDSEFTSERATDSFAKDIKDSKGDFGDFDFMG